MKKKLLEIAFQLLIILNFTSIFAQVVNVENKRIYDDTVGWSGNVSGSFAAIQNSDLLFSANFRQTTQFKTKRQNYFLLGDFTYSKGKEKVYANAGMLHFRFAQRIKSSSWKWESYAQIQYNELLDVAYRGLLGTGLRWKFYDKEKWKFFAGTSTFYEKEEIRTTNLINEHYRWSNYLSWFIDSKSYFTFTGATYYQPSWENFNDYRIQGQYTFNFKVTDHFSIKTEVTFFYDSEPNEGVRKTVYSSLFGFNYTLK